MVLKINNNLISSSHIIEGEKVNNTYFEGKYHLMLPNSEERFLTSVSERNQLLNESLRSNLYDRKTKGTISTNATSGKMFDVDEKIISHRKYETTDGYQYLQAEAAVSSWTDLKSFEIDMTFCWNKNHNYGSSVWWRLFTTNSNYDYGPRIVVTSNQLYCQARFNTGFVAEDYVFAIEKDKTYNIKFKGQTNGSHAKVTIDYKEETSLEWKTYTLYDADLEGWFVLAPNPIYVCGTGVYSSDWFPGFVYLDETKAIFTDTNDTVINAITPDTQYTKNGGTLTNVENIIRTVTQKPFNQGVTINSSEIQKGTKYLVDYPGMFQVKTEENTLAVKFLFEAEPIWKYIKQEELVEGDNTLSLVSDTEKLKFVVNTTEHLLIDSTITEDVTIASGFEQYKSLFFNPTKRYDNVTSFEMLFCVKTPTNWTSNGRIINSSDSYDGFRIDFNTNQCLFTCSNGIENTAISSNNIKNDTMYYLKWVYENRQMKSFWSTDGVNYNLNDTKTFDFSLNWSGYSIGTRSYDRNSVCVWNGSILLSKSYIKVNGEDWFTGENYTNTEGVTIKTETIHVGGEIPELTAGYLGYREGWKL